MEALRKSGKRFKVTHSWSLVTTGHAETSPFLPFRKSLAAPVQFADELADINGRGRQQPAFFLLRPWVCALNLWLHRSNTSIFYLLLRPHVELQQPQPLWCSPHSGSQVGRQALDVKQPCGKSPRHIAQHLLLKSVSKPRETILIKKGREKKGDVYIDGRGPFPSDESKAWCLVGLPLLPTSPLSVLSLGLFDCYDLLGPRGS